MREKNLCEGFSGGWDTSKESQRFCASSRDGTCYKLDVLLMATNYISYKYFKGHTQQGVSFFLCIDLQNSSSKETEKNLQCLLFEVKESLHCVHYNDKILGRTYRSPPTSSLCFSSLVPPYCQMIWRIRSLMVMKNQHCAFQTACNASGWAFFQPTHITVKPSRVSQSCQHILLRK